MGKMMYPISDAAEESGVGRTTMWELVRCGAIPTVRIGRRRLIRHADLVAFIENLEVTGGDAG